MMTLVHLVRMEPAVARAALWALVGQLDLDSSRTNLESLDLLERTQDSLMYPWSRAL